MGHIAFVMTALGGVPSYRACVGAEKKKTVKKIEETRNCWFKAAKCFRSPLSS